MKVNTPYTQIIQLDNISMQTQLSDTRIIRNFNKHYIHDIQMTLSYEIWDTIFGENDVNKIFNNFHNTFFKDFLLKLSKNENTGSKKKTVFG
jgi:hypothetical protein